jgi:hypothetical protein
MQFLRIVRLVRLTKLLRIMRVARLFQRFEDQLNVRSGCVLSAARARRRAGLAGPVLTRTARCAPPA